MTTRSRGSARHGNAGRRRRRSQVREERGDEHGTGGSADRQAPAHGGGSVMSSPVMSTAQMGAGAVSLPRIVDRLSVRPTARLLALASLARFARHFLARAGTTGG